MALEAFLKTLRSEPQAITFNDTIAIIEAYYDFSPTAFSNGTQHNKAGENEGSCKILAFGQLHGLSPEQALHCFGEYYRKDVLQNPDADSHQNIRQFMRNGWESVVFDSVALTPKTDPASV